MGTGPLRGEQKRGEDREGEGRSHLATAVNVTAAE
jgi:hypothetical protein